MNLPKDASLEDLYALRERPVIEGGKVVTQEYYSPSIEAFQKAQREIERPGYKLPDKDTATFAIFMKSSLAVSRFNGYFHAPQQVYDSIDFDMDDQSARDRQFLKKQSMSFEWFDGQIAGWLPKFHEYVDTKKFLHDEEALIVSCGFPQLLTLRTLGYRQECIRMTEEGRNIFFRRDGSVKFYFKRQEIKNAVLIDQLFSRTTHAGMDEVLLLIDVLEKYRTGVLRVLEKMYPRDHEERVGKSFFVMPVKGDGGKLFIRRFPAAAQWATHDEIGRIEGLSSSVFRNFFNLVTSVLLDFSSLGDCPYRLNPHFLRALCCQWMRDELKWDWDQIAEAMGDLKETLQAFYYSDGLRRQTSNPFTETSKSRLAEREAKSRSAQSVSLETFQAVSANLLLASEEKKELVEEKKGLKVENASLRDENAILRGQVSNLSQEVSTLRGRVDSLLERAGLTADLLGKLEGGYS